MSTVEPVVVVAGAPPAGLVVEDLIVGDGAEAVAGKQVLVHYVGVAHSTGHVFESTWERGRPLGFPLGAEWVIDGWEQGLPGMRAGGRRRLTIPPHLGYGDEWAGTVIRPNETLVFVVDLLAVSQESRCARP
jgi:peptidylprolyl isomerase